MFCCCCVTCGEEREKISCFLIYPYPLYYIYLLLFLSPYTKYTYGFIVLRGILYTLTFPNIPQPPILYFPHFSVSPLNIWSNTGWNLICTLEVLYNAYSFLYILLHIQFFTGYAWCDIWFRDLPHSVENKILFNTQIRFFYI